MAVKEKIEFDYVVWEERLDEWQSLEKGEGCFGTREHAGREANKIFLVRL